MRIGPDQPLHAVSDPTRHHIYGARLQTAGIPHELNPPFALCHIAHDRACPIRTPTVRHDDRELRRRLPQKALYTRSDALLLIERRDDDDTT
jgi:hypothetical protein